MKNHNLTNFDLMNKILRKIQEASQNAELNMRQLLGIDKFLQTIPCELVNTTSNLTEIDKPIKKI